MNSTRVVGIKSKLAHQVQNTKGSKKVIEDMNNLSKHIAFFLMHVHRINKDTKDIKEIGVYDSLQNAKSAIEVSKRLPGFRDFPDGYEIIPVRLNKINWTMGFSAFIGENVLPFRDEINTEDKQLSELGLEKVFTVYHFFEHGEDRNFEDEVRYIGIFATEEKAIDAKNTLLNLAGFKDYKDAFSIVETLLNKTEWLDGFVGWDETTG